MYHVIGPSGEIYVDIFFSFLDTVAPKSQGYDFEIGIIMSLIDCRSSHNTNVLIHKNKVKL